MSSHNARNYFKCLRRNFGAGIICGVFSWCVSHAVIVSRIIKLTCFFENDTSCSAKTKVVCFIRTLLLKLCHSISKYENSNIEFFTQIQLLSWIYLLKRKQTKALGKFMCGFMKIKIEISAIIGYNL